MDWKSAMDTNGPKRNYATNSKLEEADVRKIYALYKNESMDEFELAEKYSVSVSTIFNIIRSRSWRWLNLTPFYKERY